MDQPTGRCYQHICFFLFNSSEELRASGHDFSCDTKMGIYGLMTFIQFSGSFLSVNF